MKKAKEKTPRDGGFGWRLTFAILFTLGVIICLSFTILFLYMLNISELEYVYEHGYGDGLSYDEYKNMYITMSIVMGALTVVLAVFALLGYLGTYLGVKRKWADKMMIVVGAILCIGLVGIPALIGGKKGLNSLKEAEQFKKEQTAKSEEVLSKEETAAETTGETQTAAATAEEEEVPEFILPKTSPKVKKGITIAAAVSYGLLLIMGILLASVPAMGKMLSGMSICEDISARAYGITIGVMWVALVPSFGYYFATVAPFNLSKKTKIIISAASVALSVIMLAVFFIVIFAAKIDGIAVKEYYEDSDSWFIPASAAFATLALMVCHALMFFKINPNKIRARKPKKSGDGIFDMIKYVLANIVYGVLCLLKAILTFKELLPEVFILVATILLTWLAHFVSFVVAILVIVLLIGVVVMYFAGVISLGFGESSSQEKTVLTVDGKTVTEQPYVIDDRYQKVYKDENGNEYVSDDGGKTVREYHRFDDN